MWRMPVYPSTGPCGHSIRSISSHDLSEGVDSLTIEGRNVMIIVLSVFLFVAVMTVCLAVI